MFRDKILSLLLLSLLLVVSKPVLWAECPEGEIELTITFITGEFGDDNSWTLVDADDGTLYGEGGFYDPYDTIIEKVCVPDGRTVIFTASCCINNEGGYTVEMFGDIIASGSNFQINQQHTFTVKQQINLDVEMGLLYIDNYIITRPHYITGVFRNTGELLIENVVINWQIDEGSVQSQLIEDINLNTFQNYLFGIEEPWFATKGKHNVKVWIDKVNGMADEVSENNGTSKEVIVLERLHTRKVLIEGFTNASCSTCALVDPEMNALLWASKDIAANIVYHSYIPGYDPMYELTKTAVDARINTYGVFGTPYLIVEGNAFQGSVSQIGFEHIEYLQTKPALFNISLNEHKATYNNQTVIKTSVHLKPDDIISGKNLYLYIAYVEKAVQYEQAPGSNGIKDFIYVFRGFAGSEYGIKIDSASISHQFYQHEFLVPEEVLEANLQTIAFIQDNNDFEIFQAYAGEEVSGENNGGNIERIGNNNGEFFIKRTNPSCSDINDGKLEIINTEDYMDLSYSWENGSELPFASNLSEGEHLLLVNNDKGVIDSFYLSLYQDMAFDFDIETTPDMNNKQTGSAKIILPETIVFPEAYSFEWSTGDLGMSIENLPAGSYSVKMTDPYGCIRTKDFQIETLTSINEVADGKIDDFRIYPNPLSPDNEQLTIEFSAAGFDGNFKGQVYDLKGRVLKTINENSLSHQQKYFLNLSGWEGGMYFLKLESKGKTKVFKLIVNPF